jgi:hypothetical protein
LLSLVEYILNTHTHTHTHTHTNNTHGNIYVCEVGKNWVNLALGPPRGGAGKGNSGRLRFGGGMLAAPGRVAGPKLFTQGTPHGYLQKRVYLQRYL